MLSAIIKPMSIIIAFIACIVGVFISLYMYIKKSRNQKLACPREHPCDMVLHSRFGRTFGIPNEALGIIYFFSISLLLFLIVFTTVYTTAFLYILFFFLVFGALFSLYFVGLQAFVIKSWCAWCLGIAFTNLILIISLSQISFTEMIPMLASQKVWWVIIHNIGFILGLGSATITDIFFFRFLKDGVISQEEKETMDTLTNVIWVGLAILIVSGLALFLPEQARLAVSSKFLLKVVVVGVIVFNGILLNMFVGPHMRRLSFEGTLPARRFRRFAFALGGISFTSWYLAFLLGSLRTINIDFALALIGYAIIILGVIVGSQIAERYVTYKHTSINKDSDQS
jgi:uncharacterized membrane protein